MVLVVRREKRSFASYTRQHEFEVAQFLAAWLVLLGGLFFQLSVTFNGLLNSFLPRAFSSGGFIMLSSSVTVMLLAVGRTTGYFLQRPKNRRSAR